MRGAVFTCLISLAASATNVSKSTSLARSSGRIVGGEDANPGEFPHHVALLRFGTLYCSGSLIAADRVLTSGKCCDGQSAHNLIARVGNQHLSVQDPDQVDIGVHKIHLHRDYDDWDMLNDICILDLSSKADLSSPVIGTISLPASRVDYLPGKLCTVTGWGATIQGDFENVLQKVEVPVVSDDVCSQIYYFCESMMCAAHPQGGKDACQGDSGGPLMCGKELSGIVSWGYGCGLPGYPGVYTQTSYFIEWINKHL